MIDLPFSMPKVKSTPWRSISSQFCLRKSQYWASVMYAEGANFFWVCQSQEKYLLPLLLQVTLLCSPWSWSKSLKAMKESYRKKKKGCLFLVLVLEKDLWTYRHFKIHKYLLKIFIQWGVPLLEASLAPRQEKQKQNLNSAIWNNQFIHHHI